MLNTHQVWRRTYACLTASLLAALQPSLMLAVEPTLPAPLLAANTTPVPAPISTDPTAVPVLPDPNAPAPQSILSAPSQNVTLNLINRLVQKGILSHGEASDLIKGAEEDAVFAKAQSQAIAETQAAVIAQNAMPPVQPDSNEVRITYIPEGVKTQIRDQLRAEVLAQARAEHWAAPDAVPEWTQRIKLVGDIRTMYQGFSYPTGNNNTGVFPNFNLINTGAPFDVSGSIFSPQLNVDKHRDTYLMRMRLGFDIDLEDGFTAGIRFATGSTNTPVSTNQALGAAGPGGQGGNFSKYQLWLDRAFIRYDSSISTDTHVAAFLGRFENLFMTSSEIMWDEDVALDGIALKLDQTWNSDFKTWLSGGAFAVFNTALNFPDNSPTKAASYDKYLFAVQFGVDFKPADKIEVKMGFAYYDWMNIEGRLSSPYVPLNNTDAGDTDNSRPLFAQKGNTYRAIRNITPTALNGFGTTNQFQYFGLATPFRQFSWTGRMDLNYWEPMQVSLLGEFVKNLAFNRSAINSVAVNNRTGGGTGNFAGGDTAWFMGINVGKPYNVFNKRGDWNVGLSYRYVESDSVVDGFTDSNFGGGGTNMKGYTLSAALALSKATAIRFYYMSAAQIAGPTLRSDVVMFDLTAKF
jgi:hypothetical protein